LTWDVLEEIAFGQLRLTPKRFYKLTYRQFTNMLNGYQKEKDTESRERIIIMRNLMWAALMPTQKKGFKPTDIITFDFEQEAIKKLTLLEYNEFENEIEKVQEYYRKLDAKKNNA
jgi:hypothetical protein